MEIRFKSTRRKHNSGYGVIEKRGDLQYDQDKNAHDGIWLYLTGETGRIFVDFDRTSREFRLIAPDECVKKSTI